MKNDDCPECAAFVLQMRAVLQDVFIQSAHLRSHEDVHKALARYLALPEEAVMRLRESFGATKAGQVYARFIGASHHYRRR